MTISRTTFIGAAVAVTGACGSSAGGEDEAFLSIVGDQNVYLESGQEAELTVRYHDRDDQPLHGAIDFVVDGETAGATLAGSSVTTDDDGMASVVLEASNDQQAQFYVEASAPGAGAVTFNITIEEPSGPLEPNGIYEVDSSLNLVAGLEEGNVKDVVDNLIAITSDPAQFVVDLVADICDSVIDECAVIRDNEALFVAALDTAIDQYAPDALKAFLENGEHFGNLMQDFGVTSTLTIEGSGATRSAEHLLAGVNLRYGDEQFDHTMSDLGIDDIEAVSVSVSYSEDDDQIALDEHALPFSYGALIKLVLEQGLIRNVSDATDLAGFLTELVDCAEVGQWIETETDGTIGAGTGETACTFGLGFAAGKIMELIEDIDDTGLELVIDGEAELVSTDNNDDADVLQNGRWAGSIQYPAEVLATLEASDNSFEGQRTD